jgi:ubiquitin conjugation factor E4 B
MLSTWWIKNPYLKNKLIDVRSILPGALIAFPTVPQILYCACFTYRGQTSLLGPMLNSHPVALKYLMPALTHFYIGTPVLLSPAYHRVI